MRVELAFSAHSSSRSVRRRIMGCEGRKLYHSFLWEWWEAWASKANQSDRQKEAKVSLSWVKVKMDWEETWEWNSKMKASFRYFSHITNIRFTKVERRSLKTRKMRRARLAYLWLERGPNAGRKGELSGRTWPSLTFLTSTRGETRSWRKKTKL